MKQYDTRAVGDVVYTIDQGDVVKCTIGRIIIRKTVESYAVDYELSGESVGSGATGALELTQDKHVICDTIAEAIREYVKNIADALIEGAKENLSCNVEVDVPL